MAGAYPDLLEDLAAEHDALDRILSSLDPAAWDTPTPAEGWAVRDQVSHLAFFDEAGRRAAVDPDRFAAEVADAADDLVGYVGAPLAKGRALAGEEVLAWWRRARSALVDAMAGLDPKARFPWYGPPMSAMSFVTARLMETWAHGQDVVDAVGADRPATARLRHVAHIGVRARPFSYAVRGRDVPDGDVHVALSPPDAGGAWTWGDPAVPDRVRGTALDFCLAVTQRRHVDDTELAIEGPLAQDWMAIAQAFASGPGTGRAPGQFPR
ncbi:TIGR03084 family metal-binding protein [soil metagenome]